MAEPFQCRVNTVLHHTYLSLRRLVIVCLITCSPLPALIQPAFAQAFADISLEWQTTDNLPRAQFSPDQFSDQSAALALNGGLHLQTGDYTAINFTGLLGTAVFREFTGMNNVEVGLGATVTHKFGLGRLAPTLSVSAQLSRSEFRNNNRDSDNEIVTISLQKRLVESLNIAIGIRFENRDGDHDVPKPGTRSLPGNAFDVRGLSGYIRSDWDLNSLSWISAGFELRNGDIVSTGLPYARIAGATKALTLDTVFGEHAVAYRIDARTSIYSFDYNRAIGERATWYAGLEYQDTRGTANIDYSVGLLRSGFLYRL